MSVNRVRIKCANCGTINKIPPAEVGFRRNGDNMSICMKCCHAFRWESAVCGKCSDRDFCSGKFILRAKKFLDEISGG